MRPLRSLLPLAGLMLAATSAYAVDAQTQENAQAVNAACAADSQTAGCTDKVVGTGLVQCLAAYKKAHPEFKFSDGCRTATAKGFADYKASQQGTAPAPH